MFQVMIKKLSVFILFTSLGCHGEKAYCTKEKTTANNSSSTAPDGLTVACDFGCCGSPPSQFCCSMSIEVAVGSVAGAFGVVCLIAMIVYSCRDKCKRSRRVAPDPAEGGNAPTVDACAERRYRDTVAWQQVQDAQSSRLRLSPHHTHINVVYGGAYGSPHLGPGLAWGHQAALGRATRPIRPPVYRPRQQAPPPPYPSSSSSNSVSSQQSVQPTLPGLIPEVNDQETLPNGQPPDHDVTIATSAEDFLSMNVVAKEVDLDVEGMEELNTVTSIVNIPLDRYGGDIGSRDNSPRRSAVQSDDDLIQSRVAYPLLSVEVQLEDRAVCINPFVPVC